MFLPGLMSSFHFHFYGQTLAIIKCEHIIGKIISIVNQLRFATGAMQFCINNSKRTISCAGHNKTIAFRWPFKAFSAIAARVYCCAIRPFQAQGITRKRGSSYIHILDGNFIFPCFFKGKSGIRNFST